MTDQINVSFEYDYDCVLHMLSKDPDAKSWKVIVHCKDGEKHVAPFGRFLSYSGCTTHEGEVAWFIDYCSHGEKIEIQRPGLEDVIVRHPDTEKKNPGINPPKNKNITAKSSVKKTKSVEQIFLAVIDGGKGEHTYTHWGRNNAKPETTQGKVYDVYLLNVSKENLYQVSYEIPGGKASIDQLLSQSYHRIDTLEDFQFDFINIYHVTYFKENSHQNYSLEFWLPKYYALWALSNDGGDDIPLLNQKGLIIGKRE